VGVVSNIACFFWTYTRRTNNKKIRILCAVLLVIVSILFICLSWVWLEARQLLSCGYFWCYNEEPSMSDPKGFKTVIGAGVVFLNLIFLLVAVVLFRRELSTPRPRGRPDAFLRASKFKTIRRRAGLASLLVSIPLMCVVSGLLPCIWESFTLVHSGDTTKWAVYMNATAGIYGDLQSEVTDAWLTTVNVRLGRHWVSKFFPDTLLFYFFLEVTVLAGGLAAEFPCLGKRALMSRRVLIVWLVLFLAFFMVYWLHDHLYHGAHVFDQFFLEVPARTAGLVASAVLGLTLLPTSKHSPLLCSLNLSWESVTWFHILLGYLFLLASLVHVLLYIARFVQMGSPADILPFNWLIYYRPKPWSTAPTSNFTIPIMSTIFWPVLVCFALLPFFRRKHWELFRYSHNVMLVLIPSVLWHANTSWYYLLPGVMVWVFDRTLRFLQATEIVRVVRAEAREYLGTGAHNEQPSRADVALTKIEFQWAGQDGIHSPGMFVMINVPKVSAWEWHPFSLSSSPLDETATLHIKSQGPNSFTGKLFELAGFNDVQMHVQGPFGGVADLDQESVVLVAGGIGITPMLSAARWAVGSALAGHTLQLKRLHLIWCARSSGYFDFFHEELRLLVEHRNLSLDVTVSLYASTTDGWHGPECSLGSVVLGRPDFNVIFKEESFRGSCSVRVCGPPSMALACESACGAFSNVRFKLCSFVL